MKKKLAKKHRKRVQRHLDIWTDPLGLGHWHSSVTFYRDTNEYQAVTEIGVTDGYSGDWDATYSCAEKADAYRATEAALSAAGVDLFTWWNLGQIGIWSSDHDCVPEMVQ